MAIVASGYTLMSTQQKEAPMSTAKIGLDALLTRESSVLILTDHQPLA
jgi:hypothetical protein